MIELVHGIHLLHFMLYMQVPQVATLLADHYSNELPKSKKDLKQVQMEVQDLKTPR